MPSTSKLALVLATPAIWPPLIAAIESTARAATDGRDRRQHQLALARLAWTCRSAYKALRPHLWSTLRLVFRDRGDCPPSPPTGSKDAAAAKLLLDRHAQVMDASLFPHYNASTTSATTAGCHDSREKIKIQRIRAVSEFRYLYPLVVLGGKLYLATLHDKKKHAKTTGSLPVPTSLWEHGSSKSGGGHSDGSLTETHIVGGLHLVEYPLHLVTRIIVDFCDPSIARRFECDHLNCKTDLTAKLPFLLTANLVTNVTSFDFLAVNPRHCLGTLHRKLSHAYTGIQSHEWTVRRGGLRPAPAPAASARRVRLLNDHSFNGAHPLRAVGMPESQVTHFELHGAGVFHFCWARSQAFQSESLSTLVLDFDVDFANGHTPLDQGHVSYRFCLPALRRLALTTSVANLLFPGDSPHYRSGEPIPSKCAFPHLTHLTLIPNHTRHELLNQAPALPYSHMPNLTHFTVPLARSSNNSLNRKKNKQSHGRFALPVAHLDTLMTHAPKLLSLDLVGVAHLTLTHTPHPDQTLVVHLAKAALRASHLRSLSSAFSLPNLASLLVIVDTQGWARDLAKVAPSTLEGLTLQLSHGPIRLAQGGFWKLVADKFPTLTHLDIGACDHALDPAPKGSRDSAIDLVDAGQGLLDIEDLTVDAIAAEEQETTATTMSHLTHLAITHTYLELPPHMTLPALTSLETHIDRLNQLTPHLAHLARLVLHGKLSAVAAQHILNQVPPAADICVVPLAHSPAHSSVPATAPRDAGGPLVFVFAGALHVRTWSRVLNACAWSAPEEGAARSHTETRGVKVVLAAGVEGKHAQLIGDVVQRLMGRNLGRIEVVWDREAGASGSGKADECVRRVHEAIGGARCDGEGVRMDCEE